MLNPNLPTLPPLNLDAVGNFSTNVFWGIADPIRFQKLLEEAASLVSPGFYLGDNLFTWARNNSWLDDVAFRTAWERNIRNTSDQAIAWRRYILACAAYHCVHLEGDFVECGTYAGTGINTILDYLGGTDFPKKFWGYDTFDYNPVDGHAFPHQEEGFYDTVLERFENYPQVELVKGLIPDSFRRGCPKKIAFLHIDLNNAEGEIAALEHLFDRMVPGAILIMDDYEWSSTYRPQKAAEDPWFDQRRYRIMPLPTGQGMVIKR